jgi:hypothetical protein
MVSSKNPIQNVRTAEPSLRKKMKKFKKNHLEEDLLGHLEEARLDQRRAEDHPDQRSQDHQAEDHPDQRSQDHQAEDHPDQRSQDHLAEGHLDQRSQDHLAEGHLDQRRAEDHLGQRRAEDRQKEVLLDLSVAHLDEGW